MENEKYTLEIVIRDSDGGKHECFVIQESTDRFILFARLNNTKKAESPIPIAADFREARRLKELAVAHEHPNSPCSLQANGKYSCGAEA